MQRDHRFMLVFFTLITFVMLGVDSCEEPAPAPEQETQFVKASLAMALATANLIEASQSNQTFDQCMIATGVKTGLQGALDSVDSIAVEALSGDGKFTVKGGEFNASRCEGKPGEPEPWPPTEVDPAKLALITSGIATGLFLARTIIEPEIPTTGKGCIEGHVAIGVLDAWSTAVTGVIPDAIMGKLVTTIPDADINYSMCEDAPEMVPVTLAPENPTPLPVPAPAPEPAVATTE
jgi:hypothetical protein